MFHKRLDMKNLFHRDILDNVTKSDSFYIIGISTTQKAIERTTSSNIMHYGKKSTKCTIALKKRKKHCYFVIICILFISDNRL